MDLKRHIAVIDGWPKEGISFKDITTLLKDAEAFRESVHRLAAPLEGRQIDYIVAPEARGFMFGCAVAVELGVGLIPVRKEGKLPRETVSFTYEKEYGEDTLYMHADALKPGDRVAIIDDLLATGGTIAAVGELVRKTGAEVVATGFLIELTELHGRDRLQGDVYALVDYPL